MHRSNHKIINQTVLYSHTLRQTEATQSNGIKISMGKEKDFEKREIEEALYICALGNDNSFER